MYKNGYKQYVSLMGVILVCAFLAIPVLGRGKGGNSSRSAGRSDSAPRASQPDSSRGSSRAEAPSRPLAPPMSAPSQNRPSAPSVSQRQERSQPRSFESGRAASPRNTQQFNERPSRSVSSPARASAPATTINKSSNDSGRSRAVSSRPVQRTVEVTGTAQRNRSSSAKTSMTSGTAAPASRSGRTVATAIKATPLPKATPSSVTRKIEPSVSRSETKKTETSFSVVKGTEGQSIRGKDRVVNASPQRGKDSSLAAAPETRKKLKEKVTAASRSVREIDRTTVSSRTTTADRPSQRLMTSDKISKRIHAGRSDRSKSDSLPTTVASVADGTKDTSVPSLPDGLRREGREGRGSREEIRQRSGDSSGDVPGTTGANGDTARISRPNRDAERSGGRERDRQRQPQVVINNTNNVVVQGDITRDHVRPRIPRRLRSDVRDLHHDSHWRRHDWYHDDHHDHHGSHSSFYFSFAWSNFSCGQVAYFPYSYYHSWCHDPVGYYGLSYYYPGYHRRFIFVSLGGYWPSWYRYPRYYWYGCHPYYWYGPDIVYYPSDGVTYNTYNYYDNETPAAEPTSTPYYDLGKPKPTEETPVDEPEFQTPADLCFENAVKLFMAGNYKDAVAQFREAVTLSPEDVVLPFTYAQALFANGEYALAASVLRGAVAQIPDDELTIYYPRGLYKDEKVLNEQVTQLETAVLKEPFSADYQLLLGYQYLGLGDLNKARGPLTQAAKDQANQPTVAKLLELADKLEQEPEKEPQSSDGTL